WGVWPARIQADVIAGVVIQERNPGGFRCELSLRLADLDRAHQPPALHQTADEIGLLPVMPLEQLPQRIRHGEAQSFELPVARAGTETLQVARTVLGEPVCESREQFAQAACLRTYGSWHGSISSQVRITVAAKRPAGIVPRRPSHGQSREPTVERTR